MGERPDGDDVDAGLGDRAHRVEGHPAGCLDDDAPRDLLDAGTQVVEREVVEHDRVDPRGQDGVDLIQTVDLDLDVRGVRESRDRAFERLGERQAAGGEHREVVVLRHHGIRQRETVVVSPAVPHGLPFDRAQPRRGLAGVHDPRPRVGDGGDVPARERGDARHALHEVESDPLGGQHRPRGAGHHREHFAGDELDAVGDTDVDVDRRIGQRERRPEHGGSAEDADLTGDELGAGGRVRGDEGLAGEIAPGGVFLQRGGDDAVDGGTGQHARASGAGRDATAGESSERKWAPTESVRARDAATTCCATSSSAASSTGRGRGSAAQAARTPAARRSPASSRTSPACSHMSSCSAVRENAGAFVAAATSGSGIGAGAAIRGHAVSVAAASPARAPKTAPSRSELDASRFAPCTPVRAVSPTAYSPGTVVRPSRSVTTPPMR